MRQQYPSKFLITIMLFLTSFLGRSEDNSIKTGDTPNQSFPNVIIIVADQFIPMLINPYRESIVKTPNINQLAEEGITFKSAYSPNPLCAPARASMLTGKYSTNIGVYDNAALLRADQPTICHSLSRMGYETVLSGKVHFVGPDQLHGFSKRLVSSHYPTDFQWVKSREQKEPKSHAQNYVGSDIKVGVSNNNYEFDELAHERAIHFLNSNESKSNPFFLMVSYNFPHEPFYPPKKYWDMYKNVEPDIPGFPEDWKNHLSIMDQWLNRHHGADKIDVTDEESLKTLYRAYYSLITYIDDKVGEILDELEKQGMAEKTMVLFTSDHGDMLGNRGMVQKRGFYENSSRIPMILRLPDNSWANKKIETPVSLIDIVPTIFNYCAVPNEFRFKIDGLDMLSLVKDEDPSRYIISESHSEGVYTTCFMIRKDSFKYNYFHHFGEQLFDLKNDPNEWNDLSTNLDFLEIKSELRSLIFQNFEPDEIEIDLRESIQNRMLIQPVLKNQGVNWEYKSDKK